MTLSTIYTANCLFCSLIHIPIKDIPKLETNRNPLKHYEILNEKSK